MATYGGSYINRFMRYPKPDGYGEYQDPNADSSTEDPSAGFDPWGTNPSTGAPNEPVQTAPAEGKTEGAGPTTKPPVDDSAWDTDGYSKPKYTATDYGTAPSGWDPVKWGNTNHQTPKYVVARIIQSAGDMKDPNNRAKAIKMIQDAYPGTTYDGKDVINVPGVGRVDIFGGADAGIYSTAWQPIDGAGIGSFSGSGSPSNYPPLPKSATPETTAAKYNSLLQAFLNRMQGNK